MRRRFLSYKGSFNYKDYMTIEALIDGVTIIMPQDVEYNIGEGWVTIESGVSTPALSKGQYISFRGYLLSGPFGTIQINGSCSLRGNCMSLIGKSSPHSRAFVSLFDNCPIVEVESDFLPATTLADSCYQYMFYNCTSLTSAPALPATTLVEDCYHGMFYGCKKLNYIKMLATDISASECLSDWVFNVSSTGKFVKDPNMSSLHTGYSGIPYGWTVVNDGEQSGGDKTVNYLRKGKTSITKQLLTLDFPAETTLDVYFTLSLSGSLKSILQKGTSTLSIGLGPGESVVSIDRIEPNEDDVYIYKIDYK